MAHPPHRARPTGNTDAIVAMGITPLGTSEFRAFRELIHQRSGITLSDGKTQLVASRLARRLRALGLTDYGAYYELVTRSDPDGSELRELLNAITTNKTDFYREQHHFDFLRAVVLPRFIENARTGGEHRLRVWSAGCSTGEEPYTLAMTILTAFPPGGAFSLDLTATDLDTQVLERAREGIYPEDAIAPVPADLQRRWFRRGTGANAGKVRVSEALRQVVSFRRLNFVERPWPVEGPLDVIFCRNVMIYFNATTQREIVEGFADRLRPDGHLFIGHSETLSGFHETYEPLRGTIYRRRRAGELAGQDARPAAGPRPTPASTAATPARPGLAPARGAAPEAAAAGAIPPRGVSPPDGPPTVNVIIGGVSASREPARLRTLLGSCVCACLFDPAARVGGMNHFLLPDGLVDHDMPTRFGVNAMEMLINELLKRGADRRRLQAKAFGAAHVLSDAGLSAEVPRTNARFIKHFLAAEGIPLVSSRLGGSAPVEVLFFTDTGKALVRALGEGAARDLAREESRHDLEVRKVLSHAPDGSVELF